MSPIEIQYQADIGFIMHVMPNEILEGNQMVIVCDLSQKIPEINFISYLVYTLWPQISLVPIIIKLIAVDFAW